MPSIANQEKISKPNLQNKKVYSWVKAFRLRTLPLALASTGLGSFLAASVGYFNISVFILAILTTLLLQVLSNLANDYGDSQHGADNIDREGPKRTVQSGEISAQAMKTALYITGILTLACGIFLIYVSLGFNLQSFLFFLVLGLASMFAAIAYTSGKKPYGYAGLGDISVLLFFGLVGVLGTFYLHTHFFEKVFILPALSCGFFAMAVLNVNNIRDIKSDQIAGKKSIPVRIGRENAVIYHWFLLIGGLAFSFIYVYIDFRSYWQLLFLIIIPLLIKNGVAIRKFKKASDLDPYLKQMAITSLVYVLTFGLGQIIV